MRWWVFIVATLMAYGLAVSLLGSQASASAQNQPAVGTKVLHFPKDQCIGQVYVESDPDPARPDPTLLALHPQDPNTGMGPGSGFVGMAQGDVVVPAGRDIHLGVSDLAYGGLDLSSLWRLDPNALYRIGVFCSTNMKGQADERVLLPISHLTGLRLLSMSHTGVTSRGMQYVNCLHSLRALVFFMEPWIGDAGFAVLQDMHELEYLDCQTGITDAGLKYLAQFTNLKWLRLRVPGNIRGPGLADLAHIPRLERLCLWGEGLTDQQIRHLQGLTHLKGLTIWGDHRLTGACLEPIGKLTSLEELTFITVWTLTADGVAHLKDLQHLRRVDFGHSGIGDEGIRHLTALPHIEAIAGIRVTAEGMKMLARFQNLKSLHVALVGPSQDQKDPAGASRPAGLPSVEELCFPALSHIASLQSLEDLEVNDRSLSDDDLRYLESLSKLRRLHIVDAPGVTNRGVRSICKLRQLESLDLSMTRVTKSGLNQLSCLTNLQSLEALPSPEGMEADGTTLDLSALTNLRRLQLVLPVQDGDLACLSRLQRLEWLHLGGNISEESLRNLQNLHELRTLDIGGLSCTTGDGLTYLAGLKKLESVYLSGRISDAGVYRLAGLSPSSMCGINVWTPLPVQASTIAHVKKSLPRLFSLDVKPPPHYPTVDEVLSRSYQQQAQKQRLQIRTNASRRR